MKTILINENVYKRLFENIEDESIYNTPDKIIDGDLNVNWGSKDAQPFFLMSNHKIVFGVKGRTHNEYIKSIQNPFERRKFINSVILQGRYWKNSNIFSFWNLSSDDTNKVKTVIRLIGDLNRECFIYYQDKKYQLKCDDNGYMWFKNVSEIAPQEDIVLDDEKMALYDHWFNSDMGYIERSYAMSTFINGIQKYRPLNDYELFAATCFQIWADFLRNENSKLNTEEFKLYIDLKTKGRISFKSAFNYFHKHMRKKLTLKNQIENDIEWSGEDLNKTNNLIENFLSENEVDDTEYEIVYYDNTEKPYSYTLMLYNNKEKYINLINKAKNDGKFVIDRVGAREVQNNNTMYTFRLRLKPEYDDFWKK